MTKNAALALARTLRAKGQTVKVYRIETVYTQPGRGVTCGVTYEVR
jgi:hypothetical protein